MGYGPVKTGIEARPKAGPKGFHKKGKNITKIDGKFKSASQLKKELQPKGFYNPPSMEGKRSPIGSKLKPNVKKLKAAAKERSTRKFELRYGTIDNLKGKKK